MVSSFDFEECYPPIGHAPYWTILFGFITSTFLTYIAYSSGRGIFSLLKSVMSCRCCNRSNKTINLTKTNNWTKYPKIINIHRNNPFKENDIDKYIKDKEMYGEYSLKYKTDDDPSISVPYYEKNGIIYELYDHHWLMYVNQTTAPYYTGWVVATNRKLIKYEMAQYHEISSNQSGMKLAQTAQQEQLLINDSHWNASIDIDVRTQALNMLSLRRPKFSVFKRNEIELKSTFIDENVSTSNFSQDYKNNKTEFKEFEHWIDIKGFNIYEHNVLKHVTDINGRYLFSRYNDINQTFFFYHIQNKDLILKCIVVEDIQQITIYYNWLELVNLKKKQYDFEEKTEVIQYDFEAIQYDFEEKTEVMVKVTGKTGSDVCFARLIELLFLFMGGYQLVIDIIYFVHYAKNDRSVWQKYECYGYILTNSTNMKQMVVFLLCSCINGSVWDLYFCHFDNKSIKVFGILFWLIYLFLGIPIFATHIIPFMVVYCWVILIPTLFWCISSLCCWIFRVEEDENAIIIPSVLFVAFIYASLILWPVASMSRLYNGDQYIYSLYSVFNDRHTTDYINHFVDDYHHATQFVLWIL